MDSKNDFMTESGKMVACAISNTLQAEKYGPTYFIRPAGSFIVGQSRDKSDATGGLGIALWLVTLDWVEVTDTIRDLGAGYGLVRYFQATLPEDMIAYEGILLWGELTPDQQDSVRVQEAHHTAVKWELVTDQVPLKETKTVSILIGHVADPSQEPHIDTQVVYTWYPGRITPSRRHEDLAKSLAERTLDHYTTVKSLVGVV